MMEAKNRNRVSKEFLRNRPLINRSELARLANMSPDNIISIRMHTLKDLEEEDKIKMGKILRELAHDILAELDG